MSEELKQLIAKRGPEYAARKATEDAMKAADDARRGRIADGMRRERTTKAREVFAWLNSSGAQSVLESMRAAGLGRAVIDVASDGETVLLADGSIELWRRFRMGGVRQSFRSADEYMAWAHTLIGDDPHSAPLDTPLFALAAALADNTILDKIAEHLRTP